MPHQVMRLLDRHNQNAGQRRQPRPEAEHSGIDTVDRDRKRLGHLAVQLRGPHHQADPRARHQQPDRPQQQHRRTDHGKLVAGGAKAPWPVERQTALGPFDKRDRQPVIERRLDRAGIGPIGHQRDLLDDIEKADGGDDGALGIIADAFQHQPVGQGRQQGRRRWCQQQRCQEIDRWMRIDGIRDDPGKHRADHEKLAMRDIHHAHHAEHQ